MNITAELASRGVKSFIIATCVHKVSHGQVASMSIGWFDKIVKLALLVAGASQLAPCTHAPAQATVPLPQPFARRLTASVPGCSLLLRAA